MTPIKTHVEQIAGPGVPLFVVHLQLDGQLFTYRPLVDKHEADTIATRFHGVDPKATSILLLQGWTNRGRIA